MPVPFGYRFWADTCYMAIEPQRHHWLNMFLGIIHEAFGLTLQERYVVASAFSQLLESLQIPERGVPKVLPIPLVVEFQNGYYSKKLADALEGRSPEVVPMTAIQDDHIIPAEIWRISLMQLLETSYPDLLPMERIAADKVFADLFGALGVPQRRARFLPRDIQITESGK